MSQIRSLFRELGVWDHFAEDSVKGGMNDIADLDKAEPLEHPEGETTMNALHFMREHIQRHIQGGQTLEDFDLDAVATDEEKWAMRETPFGRINDLIGALSGQEQEEDSPVRSMPAMVRFSPSQFRLLEEIHNRFLYLLFHQGAPDLASVYDKACSEDEYDLFMGDFGQS